MSNKQEEYSHNHPHSVGGICECKCPGCADFIYPPPKQGEEKVKTLTETFIEVENDLDIEMMEEMLKIKPSALIRLKGRVAKLNFEKDTAYQKGREDVIKKLDDKMTRHRIIDTMHNFHREMLKAEEPLERRAIKYRYADSVLEIIRKV